MRYRALFAGDDAQDLLASYATATDVAVDLGGDAVADSVEYLGGHEKQTLEGEHLRQGQEIM